MTPQKSETEMFIAEKSTLAIAHAAHKQQRPLDDEAPKPRKAKAKHGNNRLNLAEIESDDTFEVTIEADDDGFDWRIALKEANGE